MNISLSKNIDCTNQLDDSDALRESMWSAGSSPQSKPYQTLEFIKSHHERQIYIFLEVRVCLCRQAAKRINSFAKVDADLTLRQTNQIKQVMRFKAATQAGMLVKLMINPDP
ncbi:uncharacterized protein PHALS_08688 [Plasmopara halstedii]|uniref:Uncharacterized protein n=1 Tax=Plasmopara halstedii TaxID=4781 RepID=A0A0P1ADF8_PLAHL|nr:uncharacterized protein PHALS_08688 [Plasmopara halstedii]CEG38626.1 hypothetical protein PHALS_08688 [Plasmopara halstedii]|eukprot:XP_024574995.1 hypothetical protein PHALS_08688 [Plasmopara halstedii]